VNHVTFVTSLSDTYIFYNNYISDIMFYDVYVYNIEKIQNNLVKTFIYIFIRSIRI
jgi:hypothetical protein